MCFACIEEQFQNEYEMMPTVSPFASDKHDLQEFLSSMDTLNARNFDERTPFVCEGGDTEQ